MPGRVYSMTAKIGNRFSVVAGVGGDDHPLVEEGAEPRFLQIRVRIAIHNEAL